jgi:cytochrome c oxidase subunit 3
MVDPRAVEPAAHFATVEQQEHAAHLGMWIFLASEVLLFAGLFALYASYRLAYGAGFIDGVAHNTRVLGSVNTAVLLASSFAVAQAVHALRTGRARLAVALVGVTLAAGVAFLAIKFTEYALHFHEGIWPGGQGRFFHAHTTAGLAEFWTLYFVMTGLHAIHVTVGMAVLAVLAWQVASGRVSAAKPWPLAVGATYWHLVDVIWIFLWPIFYLAGRG